MTIIEDKNEHSNFYSGLLKLTLNLLTSTNIGEVTRQVITPKHTI